MTQGPDGRPAGANIPEAPSGQGSGSAEPPLTTEVPINSGDSSSDKDSDNRPISSVIKKPTQPSPPKSATAEEGAMTDPSPEEVEAQKKKAAEEQAAADAERKRKGKNVPSFPENVLIFEQEIDSAPLKLPELDDVDVLNMESSESDPRPNSPPEQQPSKASPPPSPKRKPTSSKSKKERVHVSRKHLSKIKTGVEKLTSLAEELKGQIPSIDDIRSMATNLAYLQEAVYDHLLYHDKFMAEMEEIDLSTADHFRELIQDVAEFQRCTTENTEKFATDNAVEIHGLQQQIKAKDKQIRELQQAITDLKLEKQREAETLALAHTINDTVTQLEYNISAKVTKDIMKAFSEQFGQKSTGGLELTAEEVEIVEKLRAEKKAKADEEERLRAKELEKKIAADLAAEQAAKQAAEEAAKLKAEEDAQKAKELADKLAAEQAAKAAEELAAKEAADRELAEKLKNDELLKSSQGPFGSDDEGDLDLSDDETKDQSPEEIAQAEAKKELEEKIFQAWDTFISENPNEDTEKFVYCDGAIVYKDLSAPQENYIEIPQPSYGRQLRDDHFVPYKSYLVPKSTLLQVDLPLTPNAFFFNIWTPSLQGLSTDRLDREMNSKNAAFYKKHQQLRSNVWSAIKITYLEKVEKRSFRSQPWFKYYVRRGDQSFMISDADFIDVNPNDLLVLWEFLKRTKSYNTTRELAQIRIQNFLDMYIFDVFRHDTELGPILTGANWLDLKPNLSFPGIETTELGARKSPELGFVYRAADGKKFLRARQIYKFSSSFLRTILKTIEERPKGDEEALKLVGDRIKWWLVVREWAIFADRSLHPLQE